MKVLKWYFEWNSKFGIILKWNYAFILYYFKESLVFFLGDWAKVDLEKYLCKGFPSEFEKQRN